MKAIIETIGQTAFIVVLAMFIVAMCIFIAKAVLQKKPVKPVDMYGIVGFKLNKMFDIHSTKTNQFKKSY